MAEDPLKQKPDSSPPEDLAVGIPMRKTSPAVWIGAIMGVLFVGGLTAWAAKGSGESASVRAEQPKGAAQDASQLTAKEAREHLLTTQRALAAAEQEVEAQKQAEAAAQPEVNVKEPDAPAPKPVAQRSDPPTSAEPKAPQQSKKKLESLDSLGADITSALK